MSIARPRALSALAGALAACLAGGAAALVPGAARSAPLPGREADASAAPAKPAPALDPTLAGLPRKCKSVPRYRTVDPARDARRRGTFATRFPGWSRDVWVSVPLAPAPAEGWPLVLSLWGSGSSGERMCTIIGLPTLAHDLPAIVIAPSQDGDYRNRADVSAARVALDAALARFPVDRTRVSLFGSSLGGWEVWRTLSENPEPYAAAALYAAPPPALWIDRMLRHSTPPLYLYVGELDRARLSAMEEAYTKLFELHREVELHVMPGWDHGPAFSKQRAEYLEKVFPFLLAHRLPPPAKS